MPHRDSVNSHDAAFFCPKHTNTMTRYIEEKELDNYKARMEKLLVKCRNQIANDAIRIKRDEAELEKLKEKVYRMEERYEPEELSRAATDEETESFFDGIKASFIDSDRERDSLDLRRAIVIEVTK